MATVNEITVKGIKQLPNYSTQASVFVKGTDAYEAVRLGRDLTLATEAGATATGTVVAKKVGALLDLTAEFGSFNVHTFGYPYSVLSLVQALGDANGEDPVDVTRLYSVFMLQMQPQSVVQPSTAPTTTAAPASTTMSSNPAPAASTAGTTESSAGATSTTTANPSA